MNVRGKGVDYARALLLALVLGASLAVPGCGGSHTPPPSPSPSRATIPVSPTSTSSTALNVKDFGAKGDGSTDDHAALQRAVDQAAASGATVVVPPGTYRSVTPLSLPDHVNIRGSGDSSWILGTVVFGSHDSLARLKIGHIGECALTNARGATGTSFTACRFHGGGSTQGIDSSVVYLGGSQGNVSNVTFTDCAIERTSYVPPSGVDAYARGVGNTITIHEFCYLPNDGHVEHITFHKCDLGAFNGHASGALRMVMEAFTWDNGTGHVYHGWKDLTFDGCTIEASDTAGLDFADKQLSADPSQHSSSGVVITGCTFLGAHRNAASTYTGLPIVYECPTGVVIKDNTFYASPHEAIGGSHVGQGVTDAPGLLVEGNTFDMTKSPVGLHHVDGEPCISLKGFKSTITGNRFVYGAGMGVLIEADESDAAGNVISANTFTDTRTAGGEPTIQLVSSSGFTCTDNHIDGNTITNRAAGAAGVIAQAGGGTNYATGNTIDAGSAVPVVVQSGRLVHSNNRVH